MVNNTNLKYIFNLNIIVMILYFVNLNNSSNSIDFFFYMIGIILFYSNYNNILNFKKLLLCYLSYIILSIMISYGYTFMFERYNMHLVDDNLISLIFGLGNFLNSSDNYFQHLWLFHTVIQFNLILLVFIKIFNKNLFKLIIFVLMISLIILDYFFIDESFYSFLFRYKQICMGMIIGFVIYKTKIIELLEKYLLLTSLLSLFSFIYIIFCVFIFNSSLQILNYIIFFIFICLTFCKTNLFSILLSKLKILDDEYITYFVFTILCFNLVNLNSTNFFINLIGFVLCIIICKIISFLMINVFIKNYPFAKYSKIILIVCCFISVLFYSAYHENEENDDFNLAKNSVYNFINLTQNIDKNSQLLRENFELNEVNKFEQKISFISNFILNDMAEITKKEFKNSNSFLGEDLKIEEVNLEATDYIIIQIESVDKINYESLSGFVKKYEKSKIIFMHSLKNSTLNTLYARLEAENDNVGVIDLKNINFEVQELSKFKQYEIIKEIKHKIIDMEK